MAETTMTDTLPRCVPCDHSAAHGWWGDSIPRGHTHCRNCHATWPGGNRFGHCSACHRTFAGIKAFDRHQMVTKDGEVHPKSFCAVSSTENGKESILRTTAHRSFQVSASYTLEMRQAAWGSYWAEAKDNVNPWASQETNTKENT